MSDLYPGYNPNDAPAIYAVLTALIADVDPPRADVARVDGGRLFLRGKCWADAGEHTGYHIWYCCFRLGRTVPVRELGPFGSLVGFGEAPAESFSCLPGPPQYRPGGALDGWREAYDTAYAALT
jgi:hypothetical protein